MAYFRWLLALWVGKIVKKIIRFFNITGGTALPGLLALKIDPKFLLKVRNNLEYSIVITGTNGKTTTAGIISQILKTKEQNILNNEAGSNLKRGIVSSILGRISFWGRMPKSIGIWEVDEAAMPEVIKEIKPKILVILNLFRDQLDRYGEIDSIRKKWEGAVGHISKDSFLVLNGLDPSLNLLSSKSSAKVLYFGIKDENRSLKKVSHYADQVFCPRCSNKLSYSEIYLSHLGIYKCKKCGFGAPSLDRWAEEVFEKDQKTFLKICGENFCENIKIDLQGLYNVFNVLASFCVAEILGFSTKEIKFALEKFSPRFGRAEKIKSNGNIYYIYLIKNPTGANEVIRTLFGKGGEKNLIIALNDKIADGRDVSWIWDVDFEKIRGKIKKLLITGTRALDMALRLKYAGIKNFDLMTSNFDEAVEYLIKSKEDFWCMPTYTAMLALRTKLAKKLGKKQFWE